MPLELCRTDTGSEDVGKGWQLMGWTSPGQREGMNNWVTEHCWEVKGWGQPWKENWVRDRKGKEGSHNRGGGGVHVRLYGRSLHWWWSGARCGLVNWWWSGVEGGFGVWGILQSFRRMAGFGMGRWLQMPKLSILHDQEIFLGRKEGVSGQSFPPPLGKAQLLTWSQKAWPAPSQSHPLLTCFPVAMFHHLMDLFQSHVYEAPLSFRLLRAPFHSLFMSQMELSFPQRRLSPTHLKLVQCVIIAHSTLFFFFILISRSPLHCPPLLDRKFHLGRNHDIFVYLTSPVPTGVPGIK